MSEIIDGLIEMMELWRDHASDEDAAIIQAGIDAMRQAESSVPEAPGA